MTKNASLHKVRVDGSVVIFQINAPAVAGALTRSKGQPSAALLERLIAALGTSALHFERSEKSGKWYVRAEFPEQAPARVRDNDTQVTGEHTCSACGGTGRYNAGYGICYRCKGKGKTTVADRRRNSRYEMHRRARADARLAG